MESVNKTKAKSQKNKKPMIIILAAVILGGAFVTYLLLNPSLSTDNAMVERTKATVSTKIMGIISKINVKEGDFVSKGNLLIELNASELEAQKKQAEANLVVVRESVGLSQVNFDKSNNDYSRAQKQYQDKIISTEAYEHVQKAYESAHVDFTLAQKKVEIAQAQLDLINATLATCKISAPFDAIVAKKWMNEGDVLQPAQPLLTLYDSKEATVTANFEETKIRLFKIGQKVDVRVDAYPGKVFYGHVDEIGTNTGNQFSLIPVNNAAGNFTKVTQRIPVKIKLDESTNLKDTSAKPLLPGMSALVDVKQ